MRHVDPEATQEVGFVDVHDADDDFRAVLFISLARVLNSCRATEESILRV